MRNNEEFRQLVKDKYNGLKAERIRKRKRLMKLTSSFVIFVIIVTVFIGSRIAKKLFGGTLYEADAPIYAGDSNASDEFPSDETEPEQNVITNNDEAKDAVTDTNDGMYDASSPACELPDNTIGEPIGSDESKDNEDSFTSGKPNESTDFESSFSPDEPIPPEYADESCLPDPPDITYPLDVYFTWDEFVAGDGELYGNLLDFSKYPEYFDTRLVYSEPCGSLSEQKNYTIHISGGILTVYPLMTDAEKSCSILDFVLSNHGFTENLPVFTDIDDCRINTPYLYKYTKEGIDVYALSDGGAAFKIYLKIENYIFRATSDGYAFTQNGLLPTGKAYEISKELFEGNIALYEIGDFLNPDSKAISALKALVDEAKSE